MRLLKGLHVHVPRTAGNTVRITIGSCLHLFAHDPVSNIIKRFEPQQWDQLYKFGVVRNPWDRAYSAYILHNYMRQDRRSKYRSDLDWQREDFHKWLHSTEKEGNWYSELSPEKLYTIDGRCPLDHVYKFEDGVTWNIRHMASVLDCELPLGKIGKHKHGNLPRHDYRQVITEETDRDYIGRVGAWEIERFGYRFEGDGINWS